MGGADYGPDEVEDLRRYGNVPFHRPQDCYTLAGPHEGDLSAALWDLVKHLGHMVNIVEDNDNQTDAALYALEGAQNSLDTMRGILFQAAKDTTSDGASGSSPGRNHATPRA